MGNMLRMELVRWSNGEVAVLGRNTAMKLLLQKADDWAEPKEDFVTLMERLCSENTISR